MILADTSIWIEFFKGHHPFFSIMGKLLDERAIVVFEPIFGELLQGTRSLEERSIIHQYWNSLPKIEQEGIWLEGGSLSAEKKLFSQGVGLIDAAISAASRKTKLQVWTLDKKLLKILEPSEIFRIQ